MSLFSRARYYAKSILTLLSQFERPGQILSIFLGFPNSLPTEIRLRRGGFRFRVRQKMDVWVIKETCIDGDYFWGGGLQPGWNVVDIGAGLGDFTVLAAKGCQPGVVHAYEPLAESFELLQDNLALNQVENVKCFQKAAVAGKKAVKPLKEEVDAVSTRFEEDVGSTNQNSVDLVQIIERLPGSRCDFLKIDCEGCEFELLMLSPLPILSCIQNLSIETHDGYTEHKSTELAEYLRQNGFQVQQRPNPVHEYLGFLYARRP